MINSTERIYKFDNMRGIAIFFIVLGHMLFVQKFHNVQLVHNFLYIIHLPIFFFVAGYFAKIGPDQPIKAFKRLIIPYLIFNIVYTFFSIAIGIPYGWKLFVVPTFALWFLIVLFFMKMALPIYDRLKYPIIIAVILALFIGFIDFEPYFEIPRFFAFTPVFLIGFYYEDIKAKIQNSYPSIANIFSKKVIVVLIAVLVILGCYLAVLQFPFKVIAMNSHYANNFGFISRAVILFLGTAFALLLHYFVSNRNTFITKIGQNSMAVYILHVYLVKIIYVNYKMLHINDGKVFMVFAVVASLAIVFILSRDFVTVAMNKLTDVVFNLLTKRVS